MTLDDIDWHPDATGVGSLLMIDAELPRDQFDHPYQPLFWFNSASQAIGLVRDVAGHVLAYESNADGGAPLSDPPGCQRVPEAIEVAAGHWWAEQVGSPPELS